jgi:hypothetical protein
MKHFKPLIISAAICSFLLAVATPLVFSGLVALSRTVVLSKYREIDLNAIDHERIKHVQDGRFSDDWGAVPEWLTEGYRNWYTLGWAIGILWGVNGIFLIFLCSQCSPKGHPEYGSPVPTPNQQPITTNN